MCMCFHVYVYTQIILYVDSTYSIKVDKSPSIFSQLGSALKKTVE